MTWKKSRTRRQIRHPKFVDARNGQADYIDRMNTSAFRIVPLPSEIADGAREAHRRGARDHPLVEVDSRHTYPCRHCLRWAQPGERVILFTYASIPPGRAYAETGPIFVHED